MATLSKEALPHAKAVAVAGTTIDVEEEDTTTDAADMKTDAETVTTEDAVTLATVMRGEEEEEEEEGEGAGLAIIVERKAISAVSARMIEKVGVTVGATTEVETEEDVIVIGAGTENEEETVTTVATHRIERFICERVFWPLWM